MGPAEPVPSDTQPVSQTAFKDIIHQNDQEDSMRTLHHGETGHVDLLAGLYSQLNNTNTIGNNGDLEEEEEDEGNRSNPSSPPAMFQPNLFPESQRFVPKTPLTAAKQGRSEEQDNESPSVSWNPLPSQAKSNGGTMELSQVFQGTQVPSSPVANRLHSDQMSDRPSPNLPIQHFPIHAAFSSPNLAATFPQNSSDANMNYITMKQSQEKRMTRSAEHIYTDDQSDEESQEPSYVERLKRRKKVDEESAPQLAALSAPARPGLKQLCKDGHGLPNEKGPEEQSDAPAEQQEHGLLPEDGTLSEEETEQEDDSCQPASRTQVPNSSTEEDKENHDDSTQAFTATASTHDRLSQALSRASPSLDKDTHAEGPRQTSHSPNPDETVYEIGESSQTYIVKDSQQSPTRNGSRKDGERQEDKPRSQNYSSGPFPGMDGAPLSPSKVRIRSSPPRSISQRDPPPLPSANKKTAVRSHSVSVSSNESSTEPPKVSSAPDAIRTQSSNSASQPAMVNEEKAIWPDHRDKLSSMPSRVVETPVHQQHKNIQVVVPGTTIPETSPNRIPIQGSNDGTNNDPMVQEDDDLPPMPSTEQNRAGHLQPALALSSKILSSPSGRQRRPLTEIAADGPPPESNNIEPFLNFLTEEDKEYRSMISDSPNPPRKKRRINEGQRQNLYATDPVLPVTPPRSAHTQAQKPIPKDDQNQHLNTYDVDAARRATSPENPFMQDRESIPQDPIPEAPQEAAQPEEIVTTLRGRPRTSVWDIDASPLRQPHRPRSRKFDLSRSRDKQPSRIQRLKNIRAPPVNVDDQQRPSSGGVEHPTQTSEAASVEELAAVRPVTPSGVQIAPNQVLAPWSGPKRAYYPATCLGVPPGPSTQRYVVQFEDSDPTEVPISTVKKLELRIGDAVKVDMPAVPRVAHIIRGFDDKLSEEDLKKSTNNGMGTMVDVYGYSSVILGPKQRKSLPNGGLPGPESVVKVPLSRIYLDTILWNQLKDRAFNFDEGTKTSDISLQTPPDRHFTPNTPSTRLSRSIRFMGGLLSGMVFAVSYADEKDKSHFTRLIKGNGGRIIEGFDEFFEIPSTVPLATATNPSQAPKPDQHNPNFRLTNGAEEFGFACVIADKHSRRVKYMQALALNLPCLSGRWVEDCLAQDRIIDWDLYLLPAGESMYLNGATKSRILSPTPATNAQFSQTVTSRPTLLREQSVLMVMNRGKEEETSKPYIFLTYALGASRVERVHDLKSAKSLLHQESKAGFGCSWNWIYVHGYDPDTVKRAFLGSGSSFSGPGTKKRKLSHSMSCIGGQELGLSPKLTVVGNDFVCQSLILGRLFEA